jgi:adenosylcobalamin phosphodiesterase
MRLVMRVGTTSYIYPADIPTNVRKLAGTIEDIELVFFEVDDRWNNMPDRETVRHLRELALANDLTYTVHLPLDLRLANDDNSGSLEKARRVIGPTADLEPYGYVVHLENDDFPASTELDRWVDNSIASLQELEREVEGPDRLCIENLENHEPGMLEAVMERSPVSCCIDVGHFWKQGRDPVPFMESWLPRTRVVHIHGMDGHDHRALSRMSPAELDPVMRLLNGGFGGVLTLEVFSLPNFENSLRAVTESLDRLGAQKGNGRL